MWPLILGGLGIAAFIAVAMGNNKTTATSSPKGESWHYSYSIYPAIDSEATFKGIDDSVKQLYASIGVINYNLEYPSPNTIDLDVTYPPGISPHAAPVGSSIPIGKYTLMLTGADKVS